MLGAVLALGYALLCHQLMTEPGHTPLALLVVLGPVAGLGLLSLWTSGQYLLASGGLLLAGLLGWLLQSERLSVQWLYLLQHAGMHLALALWFGLTLRPGRRPLISALAQRVHGTLSAEMEVYTRHVTLAWVGYFVLITTASLGLFFSGRFAWWSLLANVLTPIAMVLMFVGEYLLRYRLHPEFERVSIGSAMRAWRSLQSPAVAARETTPRGSAS